MIKSNPNTLSASAEITRQKNRVEYMERHLKEYQECPKIINRGNPKTRFFKTAKKLELHVAIEQKKLRVLIKDLEEKKKQKIVISEKLEMLMKIAKGLKPWLSEEIDDLIK